jgi:hypothetical protein
VEEVDVVVKGANYGWRKYEGTEIFSNDPTPLESEVTFPIIEYFHNGNPACVIGGYVYRGQKDLCHYGYYIFADLLDQFFVGSDIPSTGWTYSKVPYTCAIGSPLSCPSTVTNIFSFGEDADKDLCIRRTCHKLTTNRYCFRPWTVKSCWIRPMQYSMRYE